MSKKTFNLYCDESCHLENDQQSFMLIAYTGSAWNYVWLFPIAIGIRGWAIIEFLASDSIMQHFS